MLRHALFPAWVSNVILPLLHLDILMKIRMEWIYALTPTFCRMTLNAALQKYPRRPLRYAIEEQFTAQ